MRSLLTLVSVLLISGCASMQPEKSESLKAVGIVTRVTSDSGEVIYRLGENPLKFDHLIDLTNSVSIELLSFSGFSDSNHVLTFKIIDSGKDLVLSRGCDVMNTSLRILRPGNSSEICVLVFEDHDFYIDWYYSAYSPHEVILRVRRLLRGE